jgi:hypothetical protein
VARYATVIALTGIYIGIFGLMVAASWGQSYWIAAVFIWAVGWVFIAGALLEARRTG